MDRVDLFVGNKFPLPSAYVATVEIPPFMEGQKPKIVLWGIRMFERMAESSPINPKHACYIEVFYVAALNEVSNVDGKSESPDRRAEGEAGQ